MPSTGTACVEIHYDHRCRNSRVETIRVLPTDTGKSLSSTVCSNIPMPRLVPIRRKEAAARLGKRRFPGKHTDPGAAPGASGRPLLLYDYFKWFARPYVGTRCHAARERKYARTRKEKCPKQRGRPPPGILTRVLPAPPTSVANVSRAK